LELEKSTIDLVNDDDRPDTLGESLTQNSFSLDADTLNAIDDDKGTISDSKSSCDLG
jgi:hypothetical protein